MTDDPHTDIRWEYYELHKVCPKCGSDDILQSCIGYDITSLETSKDENKASCGNCGWKGIVHNLKPEATE